MLGETLFSVPVRGSLVDFYASVGVFISSVLTLGVVISTFAKSQFQAFQMTFMAFLPQLLVSGFMFAFDGMPRAAQWLAEIFPSTQNSPNQQYGYHPIPLIYWSDSCLPARDTMSQRNIRKFE